MIYHLLIKAFLVNEVYTKYHDLLDLTDIKKKSPEIFKLFECISYLHRETSQDYSVDDLHIALATIYPQSQVDDFTPILQSVKEQVVDSTKVLRYLDTLRERQQALQLARTSLALAEGTGTKENVLHEIDTFTKSTKDETEEAQESIDEDLEKLLTEKSLEEQGLRWRLASLNKRLGSLRMGNFGFLFARPETGKTTFLASEITHMATQSTRPILWFNNEQAHEEVMWRIIQAALGIDLLTLRTRYSDSINQYKSTVGRNIKVITDPVLHRQRVESECSRYNPSLIILDQIDAIGGFVTDRNDLELTAIYTWVRSLAARIAPAIGVCQAGQSGEGKKWLTMNDVNNSKTGKQGTADWILGIGKLPDLESSSYRYFHLSKNKLPGDLDTDPSLRHDRWEVMIKPNIARYIDI